MTTMGERKGMLPDYIDPDSWEGFIEMRKSMNKKAWTPRAEGMALKRLSGFHNRGLDVNEILDQSTFMCWKGLFEVKNAESNRPYQSKSDRADEALFAKYPELRSQ
jgi:hypothetical protein